MTERWTVAQQRDIVAQYRRTRRPSCPLDHTALRVDRDTTVTDPHAVLFSCPSCGNAFHASDVEELPQS